MNILKQAPQPTEVQRWAARHDELGRQMVVTQAEAAKALEAARDALLADNEPAANTHSDSAARLEAKARAQAAAITEAKKRHAAALETEKAARRSQAVANEEKLLGAIRQAQIAYGQVLARELAAAQVVHAAQQSYKANLAGWDIPDRARALGEQTINLLPISEFARALEILDPAAFAQTGLPRYTEISLEKKS
jgi:hypothetical protein